MSCVLTIENVASLTSGDPVTIALNEHGLSIGRAAHADWTLPDPRNLISSLHADIDFVEGQYILTDRSTNGTFVNGSNRRLAAPHTLREGDLISIGSYEVRVNLGGSPGATGGGFGAAQAASAGSGLDWLNAAGAASKPADIDRFGKEAPRDVFQSGSDPLMGNFAPPAPIAPPIDPFGLSARPAGGFAPPPAAAAASVDPFGLAASPSAPASAAPANPFGLAVTPQPAAAPIFSPPSAPPPTPATSPAANPFGTSSAPPPPAATAADNPWAKLHAFDQIDFSVAVAQGTPPATTVPPVAQPPATPGSAQVSTPVAATPAAAGVGDDGYARFLAAAGLKPRDIGDVPPGQVLEAAGKLLRQAADGLIRLLDARTRVRHQFGVGAQVTSFQAQGNNPLKWTRVPEQALRQLVGEPDPGFLGGAQAVQGAFEDLQAHEVAMLAAMQEALSATVQRFSPDAIKTRAQAKRSLLPGAREAALWQAFELEYRTLAAESDAAYLDLFARHFRTAYERNVKKS